MHTQHVADRLSCGQLYEALQSQDFLSDLGAYLFANLSANLSLDCSQAIFTSQKGQAGPYGRAGLVESDRSLRCPRASNCLPCSPSSQAFPLVVASKKKSSLWLIQSRSPWNPSTQANTSNTITGRAFGPVPHCATSETGAQKLCKALAKLLQEFCSRCTHRWEYQSEGTQCYI
ncbi:hypothetical protein C8N36_107213 [Pelagimonas varians]|uniref:Uncharacterized protein n=1 Tax=Pelagimonas varians TaxID=696760 RepID=A0A238KBX8_9RHOB|nr:hypothetical protein C8N36_107213 [Pelagimonas varians]SMX40348.1 hypothetical protein PEV8663_01983 [Pelagimonas varians]